MMSDPVHQEKYGFEAHERWIADWIALELHSKHVLLIGFNDPGFESYLSQKGIEVNSIRLTYGNGDGETADKFEINEWSQSIPPQVDVIISSIPLSAFPETAAENLIGFVAKHTSCVMFRQNPSMNTPLSRGDIRTQGYWGELFASRGFFRNFQVEASSEGTSFICFKKPDLPISDTVRHYEDRLWRLETENQIRKTLAVEQSDKLAQINESYGLLSKEYDQSQEELRATLNVVRNLRLNWETLQASPSYRIWRKTQDFRLKLIPIGTRRERLMFRVYKGLLLLSNQGMKSFSNAVWWKFFKHQGRSSVSKSTGRLTVDPPRTKAEVPARTAVVDVIVCVHNALEDVRRCLETVEQYTNTPYRLILVDDGSDEPTANFLKSYSKSHECTLLRSDQATGYTRAANRGIQASTGEFFVLLNSDTIVTPGWVDKMVACAEAGEKVGVVGPLSNTASWQSIPRIEDMGDWASNPLPFGVTVEMMGERVDAASDRLYPDMKLLNGFCLLIRRKLIDEIGALDEENFGAGYGEEDDFNLRARNAGWRLALADDTYIYHAQSRSYSSEKRKLLSQRAGKILADKHGRANIASSVQYCQFGRVLEGIRARSLVLNERVESIQKGETRYKGKQILFILPIAHPGGGGNVVLYEASVMEKMGASISIFNVPENKALFEKAYPNLPFPVIYGEPKDLAYYERDFDAMVATFNPSVAWMERLGQRNPSLKRGYYIQGFEPLMYTPGTSDYYVAFNSYRQFPDLIRFTKTEWTADQIKQNLGLDSHIIGVSVNIDLFRPRPRPGPEWPERPLRVTAMVRPESPYREPFKTMKLLKEIKAAYGSKVEVAIFGTTTDNPGYHSLPTDFEFDMYGVLNQGQVASLLNQVDIFIDYSSHQAMGLTALESMGCGCAVIVPSHGGAVCYAHDGQNSLVVDTTEHKNVLDAAKRLIEDEHLRSSIQRTALYDVCQYYPEGSALKILRVLFD